MLKLGSSCNGIRGLYFFLSGSLRLPWLYSTSTYLTNEGNPCSSTSSSTCSLANLLVNNLGFSNQQSLSISEKLTKRLRIGGSKRVNDFDSVVQFLNQLGFQHSHIKKIVCREPRIFASRVHESLEPRIKLLNDLGISGSDLVQTIVSNPSILYHPLAPAIHALRTVLGSDDNVVTLLKRGNGIYFCSFANYLIPNVELLRDYCGISDDMIRNYVLRKTTVFLLRTDVFRDNLISVEEKLGISRHSAMFLYGLQLLCSLKEKKLEDKCRVFMSFGWELSDVKALIKRHPVCLTSAKASIKERLDFLMNQLGYKPAYLASQVSLFTYSMEKRLLPRHRVLQILKEKGLLRKNYSFVTASKYKESKFLEKFVLPFEGVHQAYAQVTGSTVGLFNVRRAKGQSGRISDSDGGR